MNGLTDLLERVRPPESDSPLLSLAAIAESLDLPGETRRRIQRFSQYFWQRAHVLAPAIIDKTFQENLGAQLERVGYWADVRRYGNANYIAPNSMSTTPDDWVMYLRWPSLKHLPSLFTVSIVSFSTTRFDGVKVHDAGCVPYLQECLPQSCRACAYPLCGVDGEGREIFVCRCLEFPD